MSSLLWLRRDLRRGDLPALGAAHEAADGGEVHAVFVVDPAIWGRAGAVRTAWLAATLRATVEAYDGRLSIRYGDPRTVVPLLRRHRCDLRARVRGAVPLRPAP